MGIFTRFRDIVSANINSMLDKAEDPDKMIKLMIHEMEDTLIDLKSSCAGVIAGQKKIDRTLDEVLIKYNLWNERAELAVAKGRDSLAREALVEKKRYSQVVDTLENEISEHTGLITQYQEDIVELEAKLNNAKEKKRTLAQRHKRASGKKRAQEDIRRSDSADTMGRFDKLERRIEEMEAEAEMVNIRTNTPHEEEFDNMTADDDIENELAKMKAARQSGTE